MNRVAAVVLLALASCCTIHADEPSVERGKKALLEKSFNPPVWSIKAYNEVWKRWDGVKEAPKDYAKAFEEYYGLHPAPYPNSDFPMGLRQSKGLFSKGLSSDCMLCHGGSILGKSYVGLGNTSLDFQAVWEDMAAAEGGPARTPVTFCNVRGTSEAGSMAVFLLSFREPDLSLRPKHLDLEIHADMCEDVPAWWLLKKKKTMYYTGGGDARSVRSLMQFMMTPLNTRDSFDKAEADFRDIQAYLLSLEAPKYPLPINDKLASKGKEIFEQTCSRCHGTYGEKWTYPNRIIPLKEIGTDPKRAEGLSEKFGRYYNESWFAKERPGWFADDYTAKINDGYQAPPLDGVWATAPYFHNGSAPTVYHVLKSKARPRIFTRSYRTDRDAYDAEKLGWKIEILDKPADDKLLAIERRKVYDTSQPGRANTGHTFGDKLTEDERMAVIEYLKTL
jgi:hypothetical protein